MASGSTNNFCSKINTDLKGEIGYENELALYCKENGNMILLDPAGAIPNNSVDQEDLIIYATLTARVRNKSLVEQKPDEEFVSINFVKGQNTSPGQAPEGTSFLTTNWTDLGSVDSKLGEDLETFGMTNIDINFNGGFVPIVTVDFVDIRGATLFEQGSCSPYGAFFHQPYPIFELTVKGYYGQPIKYFLSVQKFNTSFDPGSGNYKSRAEFIGYSYAFLSDILLGFVMAAPYIEGADTRLNRIYKDYLDYYKKLGYNEGVNAFNPIKAGREGRPITVFNYVKKLQGLMGQGNTDSGPIAEIQNSVELNNVDKVNDIIIILDNIREVFGDFKEKFVELGGVDEDNILKFGKPSSPGQDDSEATPAEQIKALKEEYFYSPDGLIPFRQNIFNEEITKVPKLADITPLAQALEFTNDDENIFILDYTKFNQELDNKNIELTKVLNESRDSFKKLANEKIKNAIGFVPTIRSFFTTLLANTELFLDILKDVSAEAEEYHNTNTTETFNYNGKNQVAVGGAEGVVWAWPTYTELKQVADGAEGYVETYPGNNAKFANWPEVKFVEEFLKALQEMQKDVEQAIEAPTAEGDIYDDVPGRDNYFPLNACETPFGAEDCNNGYYNLNNTDQVFKSIGERFILASNVTGIHSNFLNTSIIATSSNKVKEWMAEGYPNFQKLKTNGYSKTTDTIDMLNGGGMSLFSSSGIPFNPRKFGGEDDNAYNSSLTYGASTYKDIGNIVGYPFINWSSVRKSNGLHPFGLGGSGLYSRARDLPMLPETVKSWNWSKVTYSGIRGGGKDKVTRVQITDTQTVSPNPDDNVSSNSRTHYWDFRKNEVLVKSPLNKKLSDSEIKSTASVFLISEPTLWTKTLIILYCGLESVISREDQLAQIPAAIKEKAFIVAVQGTSINLAGKRAIIISRLGTYYKDKVTLKLNSTQTLNMTNELPGFKVIELGYSLGGLDLFRTSGINGDELVGLIDPSLVKGTQLSDSNRWRSYSRMLWGSDGMIGLFEESNYKTLQSTIKNAGGKSQKIEKLSHSNAITEWFKIYQSDVEEITVKGATANFTDKVARVTPQSTTPPPKEDDKEPTTEAERAFATEIDIPERDAKLNWGVQGIANRQAKNWNILGRIEAHNFFNSTENITLVGQIINSAKSESGDDHVLILYNKIIESLGITEEDTYLDKAFTSYRYNQPIVISKSAKKDGGPVTVVPNIHEMQASDLIRLKEWNAAGKPYTIWAGSAKYPATVTTAIASGSGAIGAVNPESERNYVRKGFGLSAENTILESNKIQDWLEKAYQPGFGVGKVNKSKLSDGELEQRGGRLVNLDVNTPGKPNSRLANLVFPGYKDLACLNTAIYAPPPVFYTNASPTWTDGAVDQSGLNIGSSFSNINFGITDKFLTVDIYPDFEFYYKAFERVNSEFTKSMYGTKQITGDFNLKYARSLHEFNNQDLERVKAEDDNDKPKNPDTLTPSPLRSWCIVDFAFIRQVTEYNKNLLKVESAPGTAFRKSFLWLAYNNEKDGKGPIPFLPYSTSYSTKETTPKNVADNLKARGSVVDGTTRLFEIVNNLERGTLARPNPDRPNFDDIEDYKLLEWGPGSAPIDGVQLQDSVGIPPTQDTDIIDFLTDILAAGATERIENVNYLNVGGTLTETPWWRHNFPSSENGSNVPSNYYSFCGGGVMNVADDTSHTKSGLAAKGLYLGLKNNLDTYAESSKYFPGGFATGSQALPRDYYDGPIGADGKKTRLKLTLTNHNENDLNVSRTGIGAQPTLNNSTNYNRTKAWKGALAYLFLANQFHRPWTGMYSSNLKNMGPQSTLGTVSMNATVPKHSVLLLGAVLWRMRESGLLQSDDTKWNVDPTITGGLDPVCYPKMPKRVQLGSNTLDFENFYLYRGDNPIPEGSTNYVTNQGVRPPQISVLTPFNRIGIGNYPDTEIDASMFTFPRADEWPAPNNGALYAYDFFGDKGVENPFKNQYKIFTQWNSTYNAALLRYANQQALFSTTTKEAEDFVAAVKGEYERQIRDLKDYSDSAKASISEELGAYAQEHINNELEALTGNVPPGLEAFLNAQKNFAGSDEGYTRFTLLAHSFAGSFTKLRPSIYDVTAPVAKREANKNELLVKNQNKEDGRYKIIGESTASELDDFAGIGNSSAVYRLEPSAVVPRDEFDRGYSIGNRTNAIVGIPQNTSRIFNNSDGLFNGIDDLDDEFVKKYGVEIEIKTYAELKRLLNGSAPARYDENGAALEINQIVGEVPYPEEFIIKTVNPNDKLYDYIDAKGFPKKSDDWEDVQSYNNFYSDNIFRDPSNQGGKPKKFKVARGQINFHPLKFEDGFSSPLSDVEPFGGKYRKDVQPTITIPQVAELEGGYPLKFFGPDSTYSNSNIGGGGLSSSVFNDAISINANYLFNRNTYFYPKGTTQRSQMLMPYKSREWQYKISEFWGLGLTQEQTNKYLYRFIGDYSKRGARRLDLTRRTAAGNIFNSDIDTAVNDVVYDVIGAKIGRKFIVIPKGVIPETGSSSTASPQELTQEESLIKQVFENVGQLRGYTPIGPEIWFMPTSVKQVFIDEFEKFVGDQNNYLGDSSFDEILKTIDPVNFPTPAKTNGYPNVFEDEITYPTIFEEFGTVGSSAPTLLRPTTDTDVSKFSNVPKDKRGIPLIPEPLIRWIQFYNYGLGSKPVTTQAASEFDNVQFREQKTQSPFDKQNNLKQQSASYNIYNELFNTFYSISYPTPRIWWGEFPLQKNTDGSLTETTHEYFTFNKQELYEFTRGFISEMLGPHIFPDYKQKLRDNYLSSLTAEALGANQDDDLRLTIYRSLKSIYDKWISASPAGKNSTERRLFYNPIGEDRILMDHFSFVNRVNQDIGDRALVNLDIVNELFYNTRNSIYGVTSDVLDGSNFNFFPLPSYVDLSAGVSLYTKTNVRQNLRQQAIKDMFRPLSTQDYFTTTLANSSGPHFLCQYVGGQSTELNLSKNKEKGCVSDQTKQEGRKQYDGTSFSLDPEKNESPPDFLNENEKSNGVVGFKVKFGSETQSHFQGVNLDQAEYKNTLEALNAIDMIANSATDGGSGGFVAKGQSLYEVFLNRSYNCTIEGLGNPMIQPLQYFELENVPMFYGSYLIQDVKHNIRPHSMKTTFTGNRVPYATVPIVEDLVSTFNLKPTQNGQLTSLGGTTGTGTLPGTSNTGTASQAVIDTSGGLYVKQADDDLYIANDRNGLAGTFLKKLMTDYGNFVQTNYPGKNWSFASNGVTRSLQDTVLGGPNRSKTSLHGAGLAIDVQFLGTFKQEDGSTVTLGNAYDKKGSFPGEKRYGYSAGNFTAVQDTEFVQSIYRFLTEVEPWKSQITWGAVFYGYCKNPAKCRNVPGVPIRENLSGGDTRYTEFNLAVNEVHHFEIKSSYQEQYWRPFKEVIEKFNLPYPPLKGSQREKVYKYPFDNPGALENDTPTAPQGDAVAGNTNIDANLQGNINGAGAVAGDYGITDYQLFTYLAWQQGSSGAAQHYSLWKRNGKRTKYTIEVKNIKANWPGSYQAKNGVKKADIDTLYNSNQNKLAEAFVDVQRQLYAKKLQVGTDLINSGGSNRSGVPYSTIKEAFEKHQKAPTVDYNNLVAFGMIENGLNTDTKKGKTFQTMFQMNSKSGDYNEVFSKLTRKQSTYNSNFEEFDNIDVLTAAAVPKMIKTFNSFKNKSGFVG